MRKATAALVIAALALLTGCDPVKRTPPGTTHILVTVIADRFGSSDPQRVVERNVGGIPFTIRLNGSLDGAPALKADRGQTMPWEARVSTPHYEHFYIKKDGKPHRWEVSVSATFATPDHWLRCNIFVDNNRIKTKSVRIIGGLTATTRCEASGSVS